MAPIQTASDGNPCSPHAPIATSTPPWHPSQIHQSESSMRSTLSAPSSISSGPSGSTPPVTPARAQRKLPAPRSIHSFINPQNLFNEPPPARPALTPIDDHSRQELAARNALRLMDGQNSRPVPYPKTPTVGAIFKANYKRVVPGFDIDMNEIDVEEELLENRTTSLRLDRDWQVDKEDGRVYHIGHQPGGAYSGTFTDDDPSNIDAKAEYKIAEMKEAWAKPARMARSRELFCLANEHVYQGKPLLLQRTSFVAEGESVMCERPGCEKALAANTYYLCLGEDTRFCVRCFEMLWNGECTGGLPNQTGTPNSSSRRDSAVIIELPQLDGARDRLHIQQPAGLGQSMHAHAHDNSAASSQPLAQQGLMKSIHPSSDDELGHPARPVCTPERHATYSEDGLQDDGPGTPGSLGSTDSNGEWRYPPTWFQKFHSIVEPGATLSEIDKAALALWKHVSMEQWRWNGHLARSDARRAFAAGETTADESLSMVALTSDTADDEEVGVLMTLTGLRKKDCQGRDLSVVLKETVEIQKKRQEK